MKNDTKANKLSKISGNLHNYIMDFLNFKDMMINSKTCKRNFNIAKKKLDSNETFKRLINFCGMLKSRKCIGGIGNTCITHCT